MKKSLFISLTAVLGLMGTICHSASSSTAELPVPVKEYGFAKPRFESSLSLFRMIKSDWKPPKDSKILWMGFDAGDVVSSIDSQWEDSKVIGLFANQDVIDYAKRNYKNRVEYHLIDYGQHQVQWENSGDLIISSWVFNTLPKAQHPQVMRNIYSYLKENGQAWFSQPKSEAKFSKALQTVVSNDEWAEVFSDKDIVFTSYEASEFALLLQKAGFKDVEAEVMTHWTIFKSRELFRYFVYSALDRYIEHLNEEQTERFVDEVTDEYIAQNPANEQGEIHYSVEMLIANGLK